MNTAFDVKTADTKSLIAKHNELADKPVTRFADRATGEKRVQALLDRAKMLASAKEMGAAGKSADAEAKANPKPKETTPTPPEPVAAAPAPAAAPKPAPAAKRQRKVKPRIDPMLRLPVDRSAAIQRSWQNGAVYEARRQRTGVTVSVGGAAAQQFRSTKAAFEEFGLPLGVHIPFRMTLKSQGKHAIEMDGVTYTFKTVAKAAA